jgi:hypothetical protein
VQFCQCLSCCCKTRNIPSTRKHEVSQIIQPDIVTTPKAKASSSEVVKLSTIDSREPASKKHVEMKEMTTKRDTDKVTVSVNPLSEPIPDYVIKPSKYRTSLPRDSMRGIEPVRPITTTVTLKSVDMVSPVSTSSPMSTTTPVATTPVLSKTVKVGRHRDSVITMTKVHTQEANFRTHVATPEKKLPPVIPTITPQAIEALLVKERKTAAYALAHARNVTYCLEQKQPFVLKTFEAFYIKGLLDAKDSRTKV